MPAMTTPNNANEVGSGTAVNIPPNAATPAPLPSTENLKVLNDEKSLLKDTGPLARNWATPTWLSGSTPFPPYALTVNVLGGANVIEVENETPLAKSTSMLPSVPVLAE